MSDADHARRHDSTRLRALMISVVTGAMSIMPSGAVSAGDVGTIRGVFVTKSEKASGDASPSQTAEGAGRRCGAEKEKVTPLQGAIVWLPAQPGLPPGEREIPEDQRVVELRIKNRVWHPQLVVLQKGQHLRVINEDPFRHWGIRVVKEKHGKLVFGMDQTLWGKGSSYAEMVQKELPAFEFPHLWGTGSPGGKHLEKTVVFVRPTAYWAVTDQDGRFEIRGVPVGTWEVAAWHREHYYLRFVRTNGKEKYRYRGRFSVTVKPRQTTDTGVVTVLTELPPLVRQVEDVVSELGGKIRELEARIDELERQLAEAKKESAASREKPSNNVESPEPKK